MTRAKWILVATACILAIIVVCSCLYYFLVWRPAVQERQALLAYMETYAASKEALFAAQNPSYEDYAVDVVFLGDSLTDFYPTAAAFPSYVTVNRGISGDTSFELEERLAVSVYELKPKVAVLLIGVNNLDTAMENYGRILDGLGQNLPHTRVVVLSLTPMGGSWTGRNAQATLHNVEISMLAKQHGYTYVDIFTPLYDAERNCLADIYAADDVHLTPAAYDVITQVLRPVLAAELAGWQAA